MSEELKPCPFCGSEAKLMGGPMAQETYSVWCLASRGKRHFLGCLGYNEAEAIAAWNTRADFPATDAPAVKVKALVWSHPSSANFKKGECFHARGAANHYAVHQRNDGWWFNIDCKTYPTLEAAKAAAQADYEARIRSALIDK